MLFDGDGLAVIRKRHAFNKGCAVRGAAVSGGVVVSVAVIADPGHGLAIAQQRIFLAIRLAVIRFRVRLAICLGALGGVLHRSLVGGINGESLFFGRWTLKF